MQAPGFTSIESGARTAELVSAARAARAGRAAEAARSGDEAQANDAAHQFEALFATTLVREMRKGLSDGFFGSGAGADVYEGWLDEHVGRTLAETGALDLAGVIKVNLGYVEPSTDTKESRS
jgi:Rod binding domain-containing protein